MRHRLSYRYHQVGDAKRFHEILHHPAFIHFPTTADTIEKEKDFLRESIEQRRRGDRYGYTILLDGRVIGGVGLQILPRRHCAEVGYFVDAAYWGRGIACEAVRHAEEIAFSGLDIVRIELNMMMKNKASERVAIKCGYRMEGIGRKKLPFGDTFTDCYVYAKVRE